MWTRFSILRALSGFATLVVVNTLFACGAACPVESQAQGANVRLAPNRVGVPSESFCEAVKKASSPTTYQMFAEAASMDEILSLVPKHKFACYELCALGRERAGDLLGVLGDPLRNDLWERVVRMFSLSESLEDMAGVIAFVRRGDRVKAELNGLDREGASNLAQLAIDAALDTLGRQAAVADANGVVREENIAVDFLLECASPSFWLDGQIEYSVPQEFQRLRFSLRCVVALAYSNSTLIATNLTSRLSEIRMAGQWHKRLDAAQSAYRRIRTRVAQAGGYPKFLLATHRKCFVR